MVPFKLNTLFSMDESHNLTEKGPGAWGGNFWDTAKSDFFWGNLQLMPKNQPPHHQLKNKGGAGSRPFALKKKTQLCYPNWQGDVHEENLKSFGGVKWINNRPVTSWGPEVFSVPQKTWNWWNMQSEPFLLKLGGFWVENFHCSESPKLVLMFWKEFHVRVCS